MSENFLVSRQKASKILGVSTRTIDRYVAKEKFSVVRDDGKVFLDSRELDEFKREKNPVVAQVVHATPAVDKKTSAAGSASSSISDPENSVLGAEDKYKILYEATKEESEKKDELLRKMHYQLGTLEAESKHSIPLLEAENSQQELEKLVQVKNDEAEKISGENLRLQENLHSAKSGRIFFFILSLFFLLLIISIFVMQNGTIFQPQ